MRTPEEREEIRSEAKDALARERREEPDRGEFEVLPKDYRSPIYEDRPHGTNPAIFDGPCDCDECQRWDIEQRKPMTIAELNDAVIAITPDGVATCINLEVWRHTPPPRKTEVKVKISAVRDSLCKSCSAQTTDDALELFRITVLPHFAKPTVAQSALEVRAVLDAEPSLSEAASL
jgi:hypothetical protein